MTRSPGMRAHNACGARPLRYPVEAELAEDRQQTVQALVPRLEHTKDRSFLATMQEWWALMEKRSIWRDTPSSAGFCYSLPLGPSNNYDEPSGCLVVRRNGS
jgi:hypothetical protein